MAFRPVSLDAQVSYTSWQDPAVDWERVAEQVLAEHGELRELDATARDERVRELFVEAFMTAVHKDPAASLRLLPIKPGATATVFYIGVIPPDEMIRIADETLGDQPKHSERRWRAFLASIRSIQNGPGAPKMRGAAERQYVDPEWLRAQFARGLRNVALNVGSVAWAWNQLTEDEAKN